MLPAKMDAGKKKQGKQREKEMFSSMHQKKTRENNVPPACGRCPAGHVAAAAQVARPAAAPEHGAAGLKISTNASE